MEFSAGFSRQLRHVTAWFCASLLVAGLAGAAEPSPAAIVIATAAIPSVLDPHKTTGTPGLLLVANVFDSLLQFNPRYAEGQARLQPALATAWTVAPDGKSIDFTLREGAFFHDGSPVTAEDVKFSLERAHAPETKNPYGSSWLGTILGVDVLSPARVRVRLSHPWSGTLYGLAARGQIIPKAYFEKVGEAGFAKQPIGSGPYRMVSQRPGDRIEFEAFSRYWNGVPAFQKVTWRGIPDINTRVAMLASHEADIITEVLPSLISTIKANGEQVLFLRGALQRVLMINSLRGGPLADRRVRLALNLAIDRKTIFGAVFGQDVPILAGPLSHYQIGGAAAAPYPYDPNEAKRLIAEAGLKDGVATEIVYMPGLLVADEELLPTLASYWKKIGIDVALHPMEQDQRQQAAQKKTYPGMLSFTKGTGSVSDPLSAFDRHLKCGSLYSSYCNPEMDALIEAGADVIDEARLDEIFSKAQRLAHDDAAHLFLFDEPSILAMGPRTRWQSDYGPDLGLSWRYLVPSR